MQPATTKKKAHQSVQAAPLAPAQDTAGALDRGPSKQTGQAQTTAVQQSITAFFTATGTRAADQITAAQPGAAHTTAPALLNAPGTSEAAHQPPPRGDNSEAPKQSTAEQTHTGMAPPLAAAASKEQHIPASGTADSAQAAAVPRHW
jgi:hypothetical protein